MKPELEDQHPIVAEHAFKPLRPSSCQLELSALDPLMHTVLEHLAVPVAEENTGMPFRRQATPESPTRGMRKLFVTGHIEAVDTYQPRVHPFIQQLDGLAFTCAFDAVDQNQQRKSRQCLESVLGLEQRLSQFRHGSIVGRFVNGVANFG